MLARTILAPVGRFASTERDIPRIKHMTDIKDEHIITLLNVLHTRIDVSEGKITRLEMSSAPIRRMPRTIITAVSIAIREL